MEDEVDLSEAAELPCAEPGCRNLAPPGQLRCQHHLIGLSAIAAVPALQPRVQKRWLAPMTLGTASLVTLWAMLIAATRAGVRPPWSVAITGTDADAAVAAHPVAQLILPACVALALGGIMAATSALRRAQAPGRRAASWVLLALGLLHVAAAALAVVIAARAAE